MDVLLGLKPNYSCFHDMLFKLWFSHRFTFLIITISHGGISYLSILSFFTFAIECFHNKCNTHRERLCQPDKVLRRIPRSLQPEMLLFHRHTLGPRLLLLLPLLHPVQDVVVAAAGLVGAATARGRHLLALGESVEGDGGAGGADGRGCDDGLQGGFFFDVG